MDSLGEPDFATNADLRRVCVEATWQIALLVSEGRMGDEKGTANELAKQLALLANAIDGRGPEYLVPQYARAEKVPDIVEPNAHLASARIDGTEEDWSGFGELALDVKAARRFTER